MNKPKYYFSDRTLGIIAVIVCALVLVTIVLILTDDYYDARHEQIQEFKKECWQQGGYIDNGIPTCHLKYGDSRYFRYVEGKE